MDYSTKEKESSLFKGGCNGTIYDYLFRVVLFRVSRSRVWLYWKTMYSKLLSYPRVLKLGYRVLRIIAVIRYWA